MESEEIEIIEQDIDMEEEENFPDDSIQGFFGHGEPIYSIALNPIVPTLVLTGSGDDHALIWDSNNASCIGESPKFNDSCISVGWSFDGQYWAAGSMDGTIHVGKINPTALQTQQAQQNDALDDTNSSIQLPTCCTLEGPDEVIWLQWHQRGHVLLAGSNDGTLWMWSIPTGNTLTVMSGQVLPVTCGTFTPDGKSIISGSEDASVVIWDPRNGNAILRYSAQHLRFHQIAITAIDVHPSNSVFCSGAGDGSIRLCHLQTNQIIATNDQHSDTIASIAFCPTIPVVVSACVTGQIYIHDMQTLMVRNRLEHDEAVVGVKFVPESHVLISFGLDSLIKVWDIRNGQLLNTLQGHRAGILDVAIAANSSTLVSCGDDRTALVFNYLAQ